MLLVFNYNTLTDLVQSGFFTFTKSHFIFATESGNANLGDTIFFFILFFTTTAASFLLNLRYTFTYSYNRSSALIDILATLLIVYFFSYYALLFVILLLSLKLGRTSAN